MTQLVGTSMAIVVKPGAAGGCSGASPTLAVDFIGAPRTGTAPTSVSFVDTTNPAATGWSWTFGDAGTSTVQNPLHAYAAAGTYTVALTATAPLGSATTTKTGYIVITGGGGCVVFDDFSRTLSGTWGTPSSGTPFPWNDFGSAVVGVSGGYGFGDLTSSDYLQGIYQDLGNTTLPWSGEFTMTFDFVHDGIDSGHYVEFFVQLVENTTDEISNAFVYLSRFPGDVSSVTTAVAAIGGPPAAFGEYDLPALPGAGVISHLKWHFAPGVTSEVKYWFAPDPEPAYQAIASATAATTSRDKRIQIVSDADFVVHVDFGPIEFCS